MLLDIIQKIEEGEKLIARPALTKDETNSSYLELYVKKYDFAGTLSKYLHDYDTQSVNQEDLFIIGPLGVGLDIDLKLSGVYICMAGGTGAYCFLDFVAYVLRYIVTQVNNRLKISDNYIDKDEDFTEISDDFRLVYMSSFSNKDNGVYVEVCKELEKLDLKYKLNKFKFINRFSDDEPKPPRWNADFLNEHIGEFSENISKVFVCGPTPFLDDSKEMLLLSGLVTKDQIKFV